MWIVDSMSDWIGMSTIRVYMLVLADATGGRMQQCVEQDDCLVHIH